MKKCFNQQETYCASPCDKFMPIMGGAHNRFNTYDECTLVYDEETLVAYLSKKCVHRGVEITNREYWQPMNVSGYADDNIIIFSDRNLAGQLKSYTLETAVPCVSIAGRKNGTIISFYNSEGIPHWELWLYWNTDTVHWEELQYWKSITNIYNKFLGWFDSLEQLDTVPINDMEGKYALVGDTLINAHIYKGSKTGWIDTGINIYQKFFDDLCSGGVELTDALKKFFLDLIGALDKDKLTIELTNIFNNIEDFPDVLDALRGLIAKILKWLLDNLDIYPDLKDILENYLKDLIDLYGKNEVTDFEVISDIEDGIANMSIIYPTSPYYDLSKMFTYNNEYSRKNESVILVPFEMTKNLHLKFTAGVWKDITNNGEPLQTGGCSYGSLRFDIPEYEGLQVRLDGGIVNPYNPEFNVFCDGLSHTIEFLGGTTFRTVTFHYYRAVGSYVGREYTKEVKVAVGNKINIDNIFVDDIAIASAANNYQGHTFYNWSESKKIYNTNGLNPYTDMDAVHSYCVLGKGDITPYYFNFDTPITEDIDLYAWYKIPVDMYYESSEGPSTTNMLFNYGDKFTPPTITPSEGQEFAGWLYDGKLYLPGQIITIIKDGVIIGTFKDVKYYMVTFDANGGSPTPAPLRIKEGGTAEEPTPPTKLGNKFNGWKNNTIPFDFNTKITKDITLTASWILDNTCTLDVDVESLEFDPNKKTIKFNVTSSTNGSINTSKLKTIDKGYATSAYLDVDNYDRENEYDVDISYYTADASKYANPETLHVSLTVHFDTFTSNLYHAFGAYIDPNFPYSVVPGKESNTVDYFNDNIVYSVDYESIDEPAVSFSPTKFNAGTTLITATLDDEAPFGSLGYITISNSCGESIRINVNYNREAAPTCNLETSIDKIAFEGNNKTIKFTINSTLSGSIDTSNIYWDRRDDGSTPCVSVNPKAFEVGLTEITVKLNSGFDNIDDLGSILLTNDCGTEKVLAIGHKKYLMRIHYQWIGNDTDRPNGSEVHMFFFSPEEKFYPNELRYYLTEPTEGLPYMYPKYFPEGSSLLITDHIVEDWIINSKYSKLYMIFNKINKVDSQGNLIVTSPVGDIFYSIGSEDNYVLYVDIPLGNPVRLPSNNVISMEYIQLPELTEDNILDIYVKVYESGGAFLTYINNDTSDWCLMEGYRYHYTVNTRTPGNTSATVQVQPGELVFIEEPVYLSLPIHVHNADYTPPEEFNSTKKRIWRVLNKSGNLLRHMVPLPNLKSGHYDFYNNTGAPVTLYVRYFKPNEEVSYNDESHPDRKMINETIKINGWLDSNGKEVNGTAHVRINLNARLPHYFSTASNIWVAGADFGGDLYDAVLYNGSNILSDSSGKVYYTFGWNR